MRYRKEIVPYVRIGWFLLGGVILLTAISILATPARGATSDSERVSCLRVEARSQSSLPRLPVGPRQEPGEHFMVSEDVNIVTGLYTRAYSLRQNGVVDYKTARQIIISEYNEYWNTVVHTKAFPLLYWEDDDQDGQFDMWVDQHGEGAPVISYRIN